MIYLFYTFYCYIKKNYLKRRRTVGNELTESNLQNYKKDCNTIQNYLYQIKSKQYKN
jgi:hypothetical protein